jgi:hypothetical protein
MVGECTRRQPGSQIASALALLSGECQDRITPESYSL